MDWARDILGIPSKVREFDAKSGQILDHPVGLKALAGWARKKPGIDLLSSFRLRAFLCPHWKRGSFTLMIIVSFSKQRFRIVDQGMRPAAL